jgi:hypothetical protein
MRLLGGAERLLTGAELLLLQPATKMTAISANAETIGTGLAVKLDYLQRVIDVYRASF